MSEDWRLVNQERYLRNKKLCKKDFPEHYDHAHCAFCWEKFGKDHLTAGYCTKDEQHWICDQCFEDFKAHFGWKVASL